MRHKSNKKTTSFVAICMSLVLGITTMFSGTTMRAEASSISTAESALTLTSNSVSSGDVNFYDSDGKTLLLSVPIQYDESGTTLNTAHPNFNDISLTRRGYGIKNWYCTTNGKTYLPDNVYNTLNIKGDMDFVAVWSTWAKRFTIEYHLDGGEFKVSEPTGFTVESNDVTLPKSVVKEGYLFDGWYKEASYQNPSDVIPSGTYIDSDSEGNIDSYHVYAKWISAEPTQVSKPTATNNAKGSIKVSFNALEGASGYELVYATDASFTQNVKQKNLVDETTFTLSNLNYGATYYFKVRAYTKDSAGQKVYGKYSAVRSCTVKNGAVKQVAKPTLKNSANGKISISFNAIENVSGYELIYATDKDFKQNVQTKDLKDKTSFTMTGAVYGNTYFVKVRAYGVNAKGNKIYGNYSMISTCKVDNGIVKQVAKPTAKNNYRGKINITFKTLAKVSGYEISYSTDKNFKKNTKIKDLKKKTAFNIADAYYGTTYYIKVRAYGTNAQGKKVYGNYSAVSSCTVKNGPVKQVAKPTAKNNAKGKINISFKALQGVSGYELVYSTDKNFKKSATTTKNLKKKTSFTMSGLFYGKTYYYKVRAYGIDTKGNKIYGNYSPVRSCTVKNGTVKQAAKPTVKNNATGKINVSFKAVADVSGYELVYSTDKNFKKNTKTKNLKKKTSFTLTKAIHGKTYYFKVRAYGVNTSGKKIYGKYSAVSSCKVENGFIEQVAKPTAKNDAVGQIKVSFTKLNSKVSGYELTYSSDKNFKKNNFTKTLGKKTTGTVTNLPQGKTYYFKVRAYANNSEGKKVYGKYSEVGSCKVTKGVQEYDLNGNMGTLTKVSIKNNTDLYVTATAPKRIKSSDECYYLVKVDPDNGSVLKQIAKAEKTTNVTFQLPVKDENGNNHIQGKFGVAIKSGENYVLITSTAYIENPEDAASYTAAFPTPASKKGRQGLYDTTMGDKNYFYNFNLNEIIGNESSYHVAYKYNGKTYYFYYPKFGDIAAVNKDGGTVTIQVMLQWASNCTDLILPSGRTQGARYYAFNTKEKDAREKLEAAFHFIAEYASEKDYHVDNWILGNEVNTYLNMNAKWYYAGYISRNEFMENYASTFRMLYYAVKSNYKNARVYICTDHTWIDRDNDWGTKYFTASFHQKIKSQNANIKWNLAYHAYSAVLTNADFWNDAELAPYSDTADFVSPNNLEILTNYVKNTFGEDVRIILSEQGFSCSGGVGSPYNEGRQSGEAVQAAAMAWLYYKAQFNDMIDAVIFSAGDHGGAGYQFDIRGRQAEYMYKYMDTPSYASYTNQYLSIINKASWQDAVVGFNADVLSKMPTR